MSHYDGFLFENLQVDISDVNYVPDASCWWEWIEKFVLLFSFATNNSGQHMGQNMEKMTLIDEN